MIVMTDAQILQNLLAVYEGIVIANDFLGGALDSVISILKELIAEFRRRIELEDGK